ncbi:MAG: glutamate synthase-related protein [Anaerolineales bacterium]
MLFYLDVEEVSVSEYRRYHIETEQAPNLKGHPSRFRVRMNRPRLAAFLLKELVHYQGNMPVILSRPCVYGVFSGPVGGFAPREQLCVGCLRCTVQYPDMVQIEPNPDRLSLGDSYVTADQVDTLLYEASTGRVPVKGAGYRGAYGGGGWDSMWTDMSEIVRPTRDGIHGREYISTAVDLGPRNTFLEFDEHGKLVDSAPSMITLPVPVIFDMPPAQAWERRYLRALIQAAESIGSLVILPLGILRQQGLESEALVPLVKGSEIDDLAALDWNPRMIEVEGVKLKDIRQLKRRWPESLICLRRPFAGPDLTDQIEAGAGCFHLTADYHGDAEGEFVMDAIQRVHHELVESGLRERVTLIGSGGVTAAEHVPKAIISGLDVVGIDTAPLLAVQAQFEGDVKAIQGSQVRLPSFEETWARQRLVNLVGSWRDQVLEILGAMGLREVRRLRGELGRSMSQHKLEREAFAGIEGFDDD